MAKTDKKDLAKKLFLDFDLTYKQIANNLDINENTVGRWAAAEDWPLLKTSINSSKDQVLRDLYKQLNFITKRNNEAIEDNDPETNPNFDDYAKVTKSIERLTKDGGVGDKIKAVLGLIDFVEKEDIEAAKVVSHWGYTYVQDEMKKVK